jgi:hypothetical protein
LAKRRFDKFFTPTEANLLVPRLEILIRKLQVEADAIRTRIGELSRSEPGVAGEPLSELVRRFPELRENATRMAEAVTEVEAMGGLLKDIDQGLVDFPCEAGSDVVFLCWQFGEREIVAWHPLDGGFARRRPLPGASKPYLN